LIAAGGKPVSTTQFMRTQCQRQYVSEPKVVYEVCLPDESGQGFVRTLEQGEQACISMESILVFRIDVARLKNF
jgi:hypothetical protein